MKVNVRRLFRFAISGALASFDGASASGVAAGASGAMGERAKAIGAALGNGRGARCAIGCAIPQSHQLALHNAKRPQPRG